MLNYELKTKDLTGGYYCSVSLCVRVAWSMDISQQRKATGSGRVFWSTPPPVLNFRVKIHVKGKSTNKTNNAIKDKSVFSHFGQN